MKYVKSRDGYIFLLTVLFIGIIAFSVVGSYLVLSVGSLQNGLAFQQASQSLANANTCVERGLMELQNDSSYSGQELFTLQEGTCEILETGGSGNDNRTLCTEGISGNSTRRLEIVVKQLLPQVTIYSWREVAEFYSCSY